jgi:hypothetical protein
LKLDKLIKDSKLVERLDKLDPDNASGGKNDGINYWKGKKIVTLAEWKRKLVRGGKIFQKGTEKDQRIKEALQFFPDDYEDPLFPSAVPLDRMEVAKDWYNQYLGLMYFRKNLKCSRLLCYNCLLCPDKEEGGQYVGISRLIARAIEVNNDDVDDMNNRNSISPRASPSLYPCSVLNIFKCPYDRNSNSKKPKHQQQKQKKEGAEKDLNSYDINDLFLFSVYAFGVESAFIKAIKEKSTVPIMNVEDIYNALTEVETLDKLLQQGLDEEHLKYKDEIVEFFMSIKDRVRMEDLTFYKTTDA